MNSRRPAPFFSLEHWAVLERRCAEWISDLTIVNLIRGLGYRLDSLRLRTRSLLSRGYRYIWRKLGLQ